MYFYMKMEELKVFFIIFILVCGVTWTTNTLLWMINSVKIDLCMFSFQYGTNVRKRAKIRNRYNQAPHPIQNTNGKVTTSELGITTRAKRSALSQ